MTLKDYCNYINQWAESKGWNKDIMLSNEVCNLHTEISEAWEEIRNGHSIQEVYYSGEDNKPEGFGIEIADLAIRIFHMCGYHNLDLEKLVEIKMKYNETRSYRHGNKTS